MPCTLKKLPVVSSRLRALSVALNIKNSAPYESALNPEVVYPLILLKVGDSCAYNAG